MACPGMDSLVGLVRSPGGSSSANASAGARELHRASEPDDDSLRRREGTKGGGVKRLCPASGPMTSPRRAEGVCPGGPAPGSGRWGLGACACARARAGGRPGAVPQVRVSGDGGGRGPRSPAFPGRRGLPGPLTRRLVGLPLRAGVCGVVPHLRNTIPVSGLQRVGQQSSPESAQLRARVIKVCY